MIEVTEIIEDKTTQGLISPYGGKLVDLVVNDEERVAKACRGEITGFSSVDDPYEEPLDPELRLTTTDHTPEEDARQIISYLMDRGFLLQDD